MSAWVPLSSGERDDLPALMASHVGGAGAVCCHPAADARLGDRWETPATVAGAPS